tara:strand:+ start:125 stop:457 length:333 start_codon:yes stop_codon:yes gene_type:complete
MRRFPLTITKTAGKKLLEIANQNKCDKLLFYVKGGGCNGFNYKLEPLYEKPEKTDEIISYESINIVIDTNSVMYLMGTVIDWKKDIMGDMFHFENPNAMSKCGCGTSFSV